MDYESVWGEGGGGVEREDREFSRVFYKYFSTGERSSNAERTSSTRYIPSQHVDANSGVSFTVHSTVQSAVSTDDIFLHASDVFTDSCQKRKFLAYFTGALGKLS